MPSTPYDRIRRRVERRGPPRRQQPQPPISSLHMITQLFTHMFQWIDQLQTNQEALVAQVQQLQGQQVETAHDVNAIWQCMTGPEEHLEEGKPSHHQLLAIPFFYAFTPNFCRWLIAVF
jgi:hypothetical protein